ncbi:aldo/keto reductase [Microvirga sp. Mcv34]|uniref:aldo/keto reductase n=1 Tax=Microvirga sp. Mcv34 TaxID=2926016 RepID=UPI0021C80F12|nr:aldo/keto reductase [Microvirga sp. Mcv34]
MRGPGRSSVSLGLGLLSIGRPWGYKQGMPPREERAYALLDHAISKGITFVDTAPGYGSSEKILGAFLEKRPTNSPPIYVSTKIAEHWDWTSQTPFVDHSYHALCRSIDQSMKTLGKVDLLQVHRPKASTLRSRDLVRALSYAQTQGIPTFGVSVSDIESAKIACRSGAFGYLQFTYNKLNTSLTHAFQLATKHSLNVIVNRPLAMGEIVETTTGEKAEALKNAFSFILDNCFSGVILTGTRSEHHLTENVSAFRAVNRVPRL